MNQFISRLSPETRNFESGIRICFRELSGKEQHSSHSRMANSIILAGGLYFEK